MGGGGRRSRSTRSCWRRGSPGCSRSRRPASCPARRSPASRRGLGHLARVARLRAVTLITVLEQVAAGLLSVIAPALAVALGAPEASGGLVLAACAAGAAAGAPLLPAVRGRAGLLGIVA